MDLDLIRWLCKQTYPIPDQEVILITDPLFKDFFSTEEVVVASHSVVRDIVLSNPDKVFIVIEPVFVRDFKGFSVYLIDTSTLNGTVRSASHRLLRKFKYILNREVRYTIQTIHIHTFPSMFEALVGLYDFNYTDYTSFFALSTNSVVLGFPMASLRPTMIHTDFLKKYRPYMSEVLETIEDITQEGEFL